MVVTSVLFLAVAFALILHAIDPFAYRSERLSLIDFPGSDWQCDDPVISLHVNSNGDTTGYICFDGVRYDVNCSTDWGHFLLITKKVEENRGIMKSDYILEGLCECTEQQITITIRKDFLFEGKYHVIILKRITT